MLKGNEKGLAREMADCLIRREGLLIKRWSYDYGVVWRGMEQLYALTGDETYFRYIQDAMDTFLEEDGIRDYTLESYNLDYICDGRQLIYLYKKTGEEKYRRAAALLRRQLAGQPRTSDGGFWHKKCYPYQMWLDGLHMAAPFYLEYALMEGEGGESVRDVCRQLILAYTHTLDPQTGLNRHGWDESRAQKWADPQTGRAPHAWGRAVGWYMVALADCLEMLPEDAADREKLLTIFHDMAAVLRRVARDGVWLQVLDCPDRLGNYPESSASCLINYALQKGARLGFLPADFGDFARESYAAILRHFVGRMEDGTLFLAKCCQGAGLGGDRYRDGSFDYYISEPVVSYDLKGTGAFIQAACERERVKA